MTQPEDMWFIFRFSSRRERELVPEEESLPLGPPHIILPKENVFFCKKNTKNTCGFLIQEREKGCP